MSASSARTHKQHLRRAWKEQKRYKEEIRGLRNELYGLKMAMKARVAAKRRRIKQQEDEILELQRTCKDEITQLW
jgi:predicted  nucleic acid-binding Zn-ribbon protein